MLLLSLVLPWFWHGVYDLILTKFSHDWIWFIIPLMAFLWYGEWRRLVEPITVLLFAC